MRKDLLLAILTLGLASLHGEPKAEEPKPEPKKPEPWPGRSILDRLFSTQCAVCHGEFKTKEKVPDGSQWVCESCFKAVNDAELLRAERLRKKLAAWDKRQPKEKTWPAKSITDAGGTVIPNVSKPGPPIKWYDGPDQVKS